MVGIEFSPHQKSGAWADERRKGNVIENPSRCLTNLFEVLLLVFRLRANILGVIVKDGCFAGAGRCICELQSAGCSGLSSR